MNILIVSYYASPSLPSSAAQNARFLASALIAAGHRVRVVSLLFLCFEDVSES